MLTAPDFAKKQITVVMANEGERIALSNSNLVIRDANGKIKFQITCYRLFLVIVIGHCSITTPLIQTARKFNFYIALMTPGFRLYSIIGAEKDGNYLLHKKQYSYNGIDIAKAITINKINNQIAELNNCREKSEAVTEAVNSMKKYIEEIPSVNGLNELMAYEGLASKLYFKNHFTNVEWKGRQPRLKKDYVNSALDIGYTFLFTFIDVLLSVYGFDTYCGVMHRQFYMRKSLVCDIIEPFRPIIDHEIKKAINLRQIKASDFILINKQYKLQYSESARYVKLLMSAILGHKDSIFAYIQAYYRAFMKDSPAERFPIYNLSED